MRNVLLIGLVSFITEVSREEEMMIKEFGDEYKNYIEKTGRLLPKL